MNQPKSLHESNIPLVSIGIPTYNRPLSLKKTLDCLRSQTYPNLEIIVSDNASTMEGVSELLHDYRKNDPRVCFFIQKENRGATWNFNFVKEQAKGTFFMWLADDDWLDSGYIEQCTAWLLAHPECVMACGLTQFYDDNLCVLYTGEKMEITYKNPIKRIQAYYTQVGYNSIYYSVMRREYIESIECKKVFGDDWMVIATMFIFGTNKIIETVYSHRVLGVSRDLHSLKKSLGIPWLFHWNYFLLLAYYIAKDILVNKIYRQNFTLIKLMYLSFSVFFIIAVLRQNIPFRGKMIMLKKKLKLFNQNKNG